MGFRTIHAEALHQAGRRAEAETRFWEPEHRRQQWQPDYPLLYLLRGFRYCGKLLAAPGRAAWGAHGPSRVVFVALAGNIPGELNALESSTPPDQPARARLGARDGACATLIEQCRSVFQRAAQTLKIAERNNWLLYFALDHPTLDHAALYEAVLNSHSRRHQSAHTSSALEIDQRGLTSAATKLDAAVTDLRRAGQQHEFPKVLLTRA